MGYEKFNWCHRWIGRLLWLCATCHGAMWLDQYSNTPHYIQSSAKAQRGIIAYVFLTLVSPLPSLFDSPLLTRPRATRSPSAQSSLFAKKHTTFSSSCSVSLTSTKSMYAVTANKDCLYFSILSVAGFFAAIAYHTPYAQVRSTALLNFLSQSDSECSVLAVDIPAYRALCLRPLCSHSQVQDQGRCPRASGRHDPREFSKIHSPDDQATDTFLRFTSPTRTAAGCRHSMSTCASSPHLGPRWNPIPLRSSRPRHPPAPLQQAESPSLLA
jgi:hypothetical protein